MKIRALIFLSFCVLVHPLMADDPAGEVTLKDIYRNHIFRERDVEGFRWMCDDHYFTALKEDATTGTQFIIQFETRSGRPVDTLLNTAGLFTTGNEKRVISDYEISPDENKILLVTGREFIYRRSTKAFHYIYDRRTQKIVPVMADGKQSFVTFSPDGRYVAFVRNNNLFLKDLEKEKIREITYDGLINHVINGMGDWVYEEEFSLTRAFTWSPDSRRIAFLVFDESQVREYDMQIWEGLYPKIYRFKYPKAGERNSVVSVKVYDIDKGETVTMDTGEEKDIYLPRIQWLPGSEMLSIIRLNRLQNLLEILQADVQTGHSKVIYREKSDTYVDFDYTDDLTYLSDGSFVKSSERSGFKHLYYYDPEGKLIRQVTEGKWEVTDLLAVDERHKTLYFLSTEVSPLERHLYKVGLNGKRKTRILSYAGINNAEFSSGLNFFINRNRSAVSPLKITLHKADGALIKVLEDNEGLLKKFRHYHLTTREFFSFITHDSVRLNGYILKPAGFDPSKKYPVLMNVYGGPGSQTVQDTWEHQYWHNYLTQKGYIIVSVDNRGTGGRGVAFKHCTYKQLGRLEVEDQIEAAGYLKTLPYVDPERIGIWGWSYGGYMAALTLFKGHKYFKTAISVAPVTNWRFYDTVYTERYMQRPEDNPEGYDSNTPIALAGLLEGRFLLIHGTADDNVHFQNSVELQKVLIGKGKQFRSFYYPDRNHGIYGGNTRYHLFEMMTDFILENL